MTAPAKLSGFPEWLPAGQLVEQHVVDTARRVFELHGFAPLETRSVEPLEQMLRKGEIDKEVYLLRRLHAAEGEPDPGLGLHFDPRLQHEKTLVRAGMRQGQLVGRAGGALEGDDVEIERSVAPTLVAFATVLAFDAHQFSKKLERTQIRHHESRRVDVRRSRVIHAVWFDRC